MCRNRSRGTHLRLPSHASKCDAEEEDDSNRPYDPHIIDIVHHLSAIVLRRDKTIASEIVTSVLSRRERNSTIRVNIAKKNKKYSYFFFIKSMDSVSLIKLLNKILKVLVWNQIVAAFSFKQLSEIPIFLTIDTFICGCVSL